jgi:ABC-type dipeptide/oligopeptide/nickel transport system permease component
MVGILLSYIFVRFVVLQLPGTLADVLTDSETNLKDLEKLSGIVKSQSGFWTSFANFFSLKWGESQLYFESSYLVIMRHFKVTASLSACSLFFTVVFSLSFFLFNVKPAFRITNVLLALPAIAVYPAVIFLFCRFTTLCPAGSSLQSRAILLAGMVQGFLVAPRFYRELEWEIDELRRKRFVLVLRAKGISVFKIWSWHIFLNVLMPVLSLLLLTVLSFISGAVLVEALFDLPGVGSLLLESIKSRDIALIFPLVMFLSFLHLFALQSGRLLKMRIAAHE